MILEILKRMNESNFYEWEMPMGVTLQLSRIVSKLETEQVEFEKSRRKLISRLADKDENGEIKVDDKGNVSFSEEALKEFNESYLEMIEEEIETGFEPLSFSIFEKCGEVAKTPNDISWIIPLLSMDKNDG